MSKLVQLKCTARNFLSFELCGCECTFKYAHGFSCSQKEKIKIVTDSAQMLFSIVILFCDHFFSSNFMS